TVDLIVRPELGPRFLFGSLKIEGLDIHGEAAIKKLWTLQEGKPFNADYPDYFLEQVRAQGIFDYLAGAKSAIKVDEQTHVADVPFSFQAPKNSGAGPRATSRRRGR